MAAVQTDLVTRAAPSSRDEVGMVVGGLADDEERAAHPAVVEEVEHLPRDRGVPLLGVG